MSTVSYALITARREKSPASETTKDSPPGLPTYVDVLVALVPGEVLALHAILISYSTKVIDSTTVITDQGLLKWGFLVLLIASGLFYYGPKKLKGMWVGGKEDWARTFIPIFAFIAWTMLQKVTAIDALWPSLQEGTRFFAGCVIAAVLAMVSGNMANKADRHDPAT